MYVGLRSFIRSAQSHDFRIGWTGKGKKWYDNLRFITEKNFDRDQTCGAIRWFLRERFVVSALKDLGIDFC